MTMKPAGNDYDWLVSPAALPWLRQAAEDTTHPLRTLQRLRKELSAERARLVVEQIELRQRARRKFARADAMFFTRQTLEQATDETLANYKAGRLAKVAEPGYWADVCCGIGGDLMGLATQHATAGIERDPVVARLALANGELLGVPWESQRCLVRCEDARALQPLDYAGWHADPDRRSHGTRTTSWDHCEPPRDWFEQWWRAGRPGAIKLAPATIPPTSELAPLECEWLGSRGECRQLVVWSHAAARHAGRRVATVCDTRGHFESVVEIPGAQAVRVDRPSSFLVESHAAVLAADLTASLAVQRELTVWPGVMGYFTSSSPLQSLLVHCYRIVEVLPFDRRKLRHWLRDRNFGRVTIKKRGVDVDVPRLERELSGPDGGPTVVCLAPSSAGVLAIVVAPLPLPETPDGA